jgi:hypothetical protein
MFPDPHAGNPAGQVATLHNYVKQYDIKFGQVWMDIEGSQYWSSSQSSNVAFFNGLVSEASKIWGHSRVGVYTSKSQWEPIMGSSTAGSSYPLWCMFTFSMAAAWMRETNLLFFLKTRTTMDVKPLAISARSEDGRSRT